MNHLLQFRQLPCTEEISPMPSPALKDEPVAGPFAQAEGLQVGKSRLFSCSTTNDDSGGAFAPKRLH